MNCAPCGSAHVPCPACHGPVTVGGRIDNEQRGHFLPDDLKTTARANAVPLKYLGNRNLLGACTSCGHVWGAVSAHALCALVQKSGTDALLRRLGPLPVRTP